MSKKLNKTQRIYAVTELDCIAVVLAISRLAIWAIKLQGYSFKIEHRKGCENVMADALFRAFEDAD